MEDDEEMMETLSTNLTNGSSGGQLCPHPTTHMAILSLIDLLTFFVGQPVIASLLWLEFTSKKKPPDILNCNLGFFHNVHYLLALVHLASIFELPNLQRKISQFMLIFVQTGAPMNLFFICGERYVAVIYPTRYPLLRKYRIRQVCSAFVWLLSISMSLASVLAVESLPSHDEKSVKIVPPTLTSVMAGLIMKFSGSTVKGLRKSGPEGVELHPAKKRALRTVSATSICSLCCYTIITSLQRIYSNQLNEKVFECVIIPACLVLLAVASLVHPVLYVHRKMFA